MPALTRAGIGLLLGLGLLAPGAPASAASPAGTVHQLIGRAMATTPQGNVRALRRAGPVYPGETLTTAPNSYLRVKYSDGGYMMLRPNTRLLIESYRHARNPRKARGFFALFRGGLRAVTGLIGKLNRNSYKLRTRLATIGIRGTDFATRICNADCTDVDPPAPDGLYVEFIADNGIEVTGQSGQLVLSAPRSYAWTPSADQPPREVSADFASPLTADPIPAADPLSCPAR